MKASLHVHLCQAQLVSGALHRPLPTARGGQSGAGRWRKQLIDAPGIKDKPQFPNRLREEEKTESTLPKMAELQQPCLEHVSDELCVAGLAPRYLGVAAADASGFFRNNRCCQSSQRVRASPCRMLAPSHLAPGEGSATRSRWKAAGFTGTTE